MDALDRRAEAVTLLTPHAAKGLEFPVVFLIGVEEGLVPFSFSGSPGGEDLAGARRLFYVGVSPVRDRLFVSHSRRPSRFLSAVGPGLFEPLGQRDRSRAAHLQPRLL